MFDKIEFDRWIKQMEVIPYLEEINTYVERVKKNWLKN